MRTSPVGRHAMPIFEHMAREMALLRGILAASAVGAVRIAMK
jgi:hypothetical protein